MIDLEKKFIYKSIKVLKKELIIN